MSELIVIFHEDERGISTSWDVVGELIRCKDCKFCEKDELFGGSWCRGYRVRDDHFCGYASRREGEEDA